MSEHNVATYLPMIMKNGNLRASKPKDGLERRDHFIRNVLDPIVKQIVDAVPVTQQAGTMRWARAFGVI